MQKKITGILIAPFLFAVAVHAQMAPPAPAPELAKLDYFAGTWNTDSDMKASSFGPGGKVTSVDHVSWMEGKFFLIIHSKFSSKAMGNGVEYAVLGYDSKRKQYTYESFNSEGEHEVATGTLDADGKVWTWYSSPETGGPMKWRYTETILSPSAYAIKFEMAPDGTNWSTVMDGKASKAAKAEIQ